MDHQIYLELALVFVGLTDPVLPAYVILWILDYIGKGKNWWHWMDQMKHIEKIRLIENVHRFNRMRFTII